LHFSICPLEAAVGAKGSEGKALQDRAEDADPSDQNYTPWVVIDDQHSRAGEADVVDAICTEYTRNGGQNRPRGCPDPGDSGKVSKDEMAQIMKDEMKAPKPCKQTLTWASSKSVIMRKQYQRRVQKLQKAVLKHVTEAAGKLSSEAKASFRHSTTVHGYSIKDHSARPEHLPPGLVP
jgi:hypothetical protein